MGYEIKVLSDKEFDRLPYEGIDDSLGFADVRRGRVFVRNTGSHEMNRYLINHEIDHLVEEHATDEDKNGIRHKKFGDFFRFLANPINLPGLGPLSNDKKGIFNTDNASSSKMEAGGIEGAGEQPQFSASPNSPSGPFGQFAVGSQGSSAVPNNIGGNVTGGLNQSSLNSPQALSPDMIERIKGYYSGRLTF